MSEHVFPWEPSTLVVAAYYNDNRSDVRVFLCTCDKGYYYPDGSIIALDEEAWTPFAWTEAPKP